MIPVRLSLLTTALLLVLTACQQQLQPHPDELQSHMLPSTAEVRFGNEGVGSPFGPFDEHDQSFHAVDKIVPRSVVIAQGGSVTYHISPAHQVAIYQPGTRPGDIEIGPDTLDDLAVPFPPFVIPDIIINDPAGRVALSPPLIFDGEQEWTTPEGTFDTPGRYLVICTTLPHFAEANMWGWVIVR